MSDDEPLIDLLLKTQGKRKRLKVYFGEDVQYVSPKVLISSLSGIFIEEKSPDVGTGIIYNLSKAKYFHWVD